MSYYPKGHRNNDNADDFDEHNPTPYAGGYDIFVTYGRPLPPSEKICYRHASGNDEFDYERPKYTSYAESSAYDNVNDEYKSYTRPKPHFTPSHEPTHASQHGYQPRMNGSGFGSGPVSEYGPGHRRKDELDDPRSELGSGFKQGGVRTNHEAHEGEGYGGQAHERPGYAQAGYEAHGGGEGYGRQAYERPGYEAQEEGHGRQTHDRPKYGRAGYEAREEREGYVRQAHERPNYGRTEEEDYCKPSSYERRNHHDENDDDDDHEGKHNSDDSDDDDDNKRNKQRHKNHHKNKHYDD